MDLPFAWVRVGSEERILLLGLADDDELIGYDPLADQVVAGFELGDIQDAINIEPAAVAPGVSVFYGDPVRMAIANPAGAGKAIPLVRKARAVPKFVMRAKGRAFRPLPPGVVSGFFTAKSIMHHHRYEKPSKHAIYLSTSFAIATANTQIARAEIAFDCFAGLYNRTWGAVEYADIHNCFTQAGTGAQNQKSAYLSRENLQPFVDLCFDYLKANFYDARLRRALARDGRMPKGLSLAKLSFTLALLGQNCVCLDARILNRMFPAEGDRERFIDQAGYKIDGYLADTSIALYERAELAFLKGNPNYDPKDPLGAVRCQWQSWESEGGATAEHRVWLRTVEALAYVGR